MNLKKILFSSHSNLSEKEKKESRLIITIILSIFVFILPWVFSFIAFKDRVVSELKTETLFGIIGAIAIYVKIIISLCSWVKDGPKK